MKTELFGICVSFIATVVLAVPLGKYISNVYALRRTWSDRIFGPVERFFYRFSKIDPDKEMTWQQNAGALLVINLVWFILGMLVLTNMGWLPLNPDGISSMPVDLAFNTAISFVSNTNLQHYAGESGVSYLGQLVLQLFQFISAGAGMAAAVLVFNSLKENSASTIGNFYRYFLLSCTRILLPISFVTAIIFLLNGVPMTFKGKEKIVTLEGDSVSVSRGPAAAMIAIKQAGTNGGGFFGVNSAHPLENPNYLTNTVQNIEILLIPMALIFALGFYLNKRKFALMIFGVMTIGFLLLLIPSLQQEWAGNPAIAKMGIDQTLGSTEGKEVRFGSMASAYWGISTTATSNGSVNAMLDSFTPLAGMNALLGMMVNCFYGGVGVGFLNFYIFIIVAVFISGLMVGRTPELMGKKVEAREMKIAMLVALLHPSLILAGTAIASSIVHSHPEFPWLNNPGYHGFSEMLYEYTSSAANNGSGFEGLGDNTVWWNISCGVIMMLSRFLPIVGPLAIAGILAQKKYIPESGGTLRTDSFTFGLMALFVILIVAALSFFPALTLGPIAEYFTQVQ